MNSLEPGVSGNSQVKSLQRGIDRLLEDGNISDEEAEDLMTISRLVLGATRDKADVFKAAAEIHQLYHRMVITGKSSPVALAISSAANASFSIPPMSGEPASVAAAVTITPGSTGAGAVIGGVIGGLLGGGLGAGIGAGIGAAAGGAIGFCNENGI